MFRSEVLVDVKRRPEYLPTNTASQVLLMVRSLVVLIAEAVQVRKSAINKCTRSWEQRTRFLDWNTSNLKGWDEKFTDNVAYSACRRRVAIHTRLHVDGCAA